MNAWLLGKVTGVEDQIARFDKTAVIEHPSSAAVRPSFRNHVGVGERLGERPSQGRRTAPDFRVLER